MQTRSLVMIVLITSLFSAISCKKKKDTTPAPANNPTPAANPYFIEGKVDGVMYRAEYVCEIPGCAASMGNYNEFMNWITMQRAMSASNPIAWNILIDNVTLDSWRVPDTLNASSFSGNENLDLSFYNGPHQSDNGFFVDGVVLGDNSFIMYVTSKAGDVIQGTFSGKLRNGSNTSSTVTVTEGKFKIKLVRE